MHRRTSVERALQRLNEDPLLRDPQPTADFWSVNGVKSHSIWRSPAPHAPHRSTLGDDPHAIINKPDAKAPSIDEQIDLMIAKARGQY